MASLGQKEGKDEGEFDDDDDKEEEEEGRGWMRNRDRETQRKYDFFARKKNDFRAYNGQIIVPANLCKKIQFSWHLKVGNYELSLISQCRLA
jgi:hypothetical protein